MKFGDSIMSFLMSAACDAERIATVADLSRAIEILTGRRDDLQAAEVAVQEAEIALQEWEAGAFWAPVIAEVFEDPDASPNRTMFCLISIARQLRNPEPKDLSELFDVLAELFDHGPEFFELVCLCLGLIVGSDPTLFERLPEARRLSVVRSLADSLSDLDGIEPFLSMIPDTISMGLSCLETFPVSGDWMEVFNKLSSFVENPVDLMEHLATIAEIARDGDLSLILPGLDNGTEELMAADAQWVLETPGRPDFVSGWVDIVVTAVGRLLDVGHFGIASRLLGLIGEYNLDFYYGQGNTIDVFDAVFQLCQRMCDAGSECVFSVLERIAASIQSWDDEWQGHDHVISAFLTLIIRMLAGNCAFCRESMPTIIASPADRQLDEPVAATIVEVLRRLIDDESNPIAVYVVAHSGECVRDKLAPLVLEKLEGIDWTDMLVIPIEFLSSVSERIDVTPELVRRVEAAIQIIPIEVIRLLRKFARRNPNAFLSEGLVDYNSLCEFAPPDEVMIDWIDLLLLILQAARMSDMVTEETVIEQLTRFGDCIIDTFGEPTVDRFVDAMKWISGLIEARRPVNPLVIAFYHQLFKEIVQRIDPFFLEPEDEDQPVLSQFIGKALVGGWVEDRRKVLGWLHDVLPGARSCHHEGLIRYLVEDISMPECEWLFEYLHGETFDEALRLRTFGYIIAGRPQFAEFIDIQRIEELSFGRRTFRDSHVEDLFIKLITLVARKRKLSTEECELVVARSADAMVGERPENITIYRLWNALCLQTGLDAASALILNRVEGFLGAECPDLMVLLARRAVTNADIDTSMNGLRSAIRERYTSTEIQIRQNCLLINHCDTFPYGVCHPVRKSTHHFIVVDG
jgi:hypothetical protein